ncbi:hypothetical protein MtrunA17_Chr2g0327261 [Medicago truncatula]|uniref:Transmembrane protein n=1 Tax=Medicago truncatula TaxID=3880 RepID=A0A396JCJ8_MEDTR|nr:hypothetical protein MtrunA17_Chr2g0327261 [Medicago truncatula]
MFFRSDLFPFLCSLIRNYLISLFFFFFILSSIEIACLVLFLCSDYAVERFM